MDLVQPYEGQDLLDARHRAPAGEGLCLVGLGRLDEIQLQLSEQAVVVIDQPEVHRDAFLHGRLRKAFGDASAVGRVGDVLADLGEVVLGLGMLDMGSELRTFSHQMHAAAEQVTGGAHGGGIDIGLREHPAAE
jgi:hypothetical protein